MYLTLFDVSMEYKWIFCVLYKVFLIWKSPVCLNGWFLVALSIHLSFLQSLCPPRSLARFSTLTRLSWISGYFSVPQSGQFVFLALALFIFTAKILAAASSTFSVSVSNSQSVLPAYYFPMFRQKKSKYDYIETCFFHKTTFSILFEPFLQGVNGLICLPVPSKIE